MIIIYIFIGIASLLLILLLIYNYYQNLQLNEEFKNLTLLRNYKY